jgi:hypothetical protein
MLNKDGLERIKKMDPALAAKIESLMSAYESSLEYVHETYKIKFDYLLTKLYKSSTVVTVV